MKTPRFFFYCQQIIDKIPKYLFTVILTCFYSTLFIYLKGIISTFTTNTVGPLIMAKYFSPLLQKGGGGFGHQPQEKVKQHKGIIVNITAKVGSIGDNGINLKIKRNNLKVLKIY